MSNETRRLIINSFTAGYKTKLIVENHTLSLPTVCSIVRKFEKTDKIDVEKRGDNKR